jgi:hypothetical protein
VVHSRLGVSAVSIEVIDAVIDVASSLGRQLMLLPSRNQVDCAEFGGGYVRGLTPDALVRHVRARAGRDQVLIGRDHGGPFMSDRDQGLAPGEAVERAAFTIATDVAAGFDLVHVDCGRFPGNVRAATRQLIDHVLACSAKAGRRTGVEVGTEDNVGATVSRTKFVDDLDFVLDHVEPEFIVGQTGSLVRETFQVGVFDFEAVAELTRIAHDAGVKFKEHNADYLSAGDIALRQAAGVDAVNIGPELGVLQTKTVVHLAATHGLHGEAEAFLRTSRESGRWRKWLYGRPSDELKAMIAGHYNFADGAYLELVDGLRARVDVDGRIRRNLTDRIGWYASVLSPAGEAAAGGSQVLPAASSFALADEGRPR